VVSNCPTFNRLNTLHSSLNCPVLNHRLTSTADDQLSRIQPGKENLDSSG
jgi:hypothetical protein